MDDQLSVLDLVVRVRPAYRVSRWAWHLVDRRDGSEFESEFEYDSASEAQRAGFRRLAELTSSLPGATADVPESLSNSWPAVRSISASRLRAA